jgi:predicted nucleic acid-binding Zn ribbon protein
MERAGRLFGKVKLSAEVADPEIRARAAWNAAAGKKIARHTRAVALVRGTLVVEVEDMMWQKQLYSLRGFLLRNLARELGEPLVRDLDLRPMPRRRGPQAAGQARPAAEGADEAEGIADPVLRGLYRKSRRESA